ncbi:CHAT domain-containing tetratricopeptide repeat protein [Microcoleus sp. B13-B6]|uniref:CHAT domain-containing tetratricopeptide repeat protein n=2 Tax=unclassified Microcoleus TaxID=2642155 RepID=UPI002FD12078
MRIGGIFIISLATFSITILGVLYWFLPEAFSESQMLVQTSREARKAEADLLFQQGTKQFRIAQFEAALNFFQQALKIYQEIGDRFGEAQALGNSAITYKKLGKYARSLEDLGKVLEIMRSIPNREGEAMALRQLGLLHRALGNYEQSLNLLEQQLELVRSLGNQKLVWEALNDLGLVYFDLSQYEKAAEAWEEQLRITKSLGNDEGTQFALSNLGMLEATRRNYQKAIEYYEQASEISVARGGLKGSIDPGLGLVYLEMGNYEKAIKAMRQYVASTQASGVPSEQAVALNNLGAALMATGKLVEASEVLLSSIKLQESLRIGLDDTNKVSLFETQGNPYRNLQQVLVTLNKSDAALEIAERGRARAFIELLAKNFYLQPGVENNINFLNIYELKQIAKEQKAFVVEYSIIPEDKKLFIWVVKPTGEAVFRKSDLKSLVQNTTLQDFIKNSLEHIVKDIISSELQQLHQLLIEPIADLLPNDPESHVIFVPQGPLFLVPFPALQDSAGKYLIEKHTIRTAPSIQVLDLTRKQRQQLSGSAKDALVVGNPQPMPKVPLLLGGPAEELPDLPDAGREASEIASLLNAKPLTGASATKTAVMSQLGQARIIHLATHGLLDDLRGLGSAIALAPSGSDSGLLTAAEILDLERTQGKSLSAELVVLSACNTGSGRITGDGVIGLSRSLISAGTPSIIVSLWSVPDAPTGFLMAEFYRQWKKNPADKAKALRSAMLVAKQTHPLPKDWAAFTLIGEAE